MWVISLKADEFRLVHDIGSFIFLDSPEGNVYYTIQFAVVPHAELHATDVPGHKIVQAEPNIIQCPFVLNMDDGMDVVVGAMKTRDASSYFYGVSSENLKNWSAADEKSFADTKYWITALRSRRPTSASSPRRCSPTPSRRSCRTTSSGARS